VVRDVHEPDSLRSTSSVTVYIMDSNDHAPVWVSPANHNASTSVVHVSSYTAVGTPVARVRAYDADADDNARVTYSCSTAADRDRHPDGLPPFDVDPDTGIIRLRVDLSATVWPQYCLSLLGLPTLDFGIPELPPFPSLPFSSPPSLPGPPSFSPSPPSFPFPGGPPLNQLRGLGEFTARCKLPHWRLGQSPSRQTIWCISEPKGAALVATVFVPFHNNKFKFPYKHKTA